MAGLCQGVDCDEWCGAVVWGQLYRGGSDCGLVMMAECGGEVVCMLSAYGVPVMELSGAVHVSVPLSAMDGVVGGLVGWCGGTVGLRELSWVLSAEVGELF